jgi:hypothetical protein
MLCARRWFARAARSRGDQVARALGPDPVVASRIVTELVEAVSEIRDLVQDRLWLECDDRLPAVDAFSTSTKSGITLRISPDGPGWTRTSDLPIMSALWRLRLFAAVR